MAASHSPMLFSASSAPHLIKAKVVILGDSGIGKSSLALRYVIRQFHEYQEATIGAAFLTKTLVDTNNNEVKFEIWDTAGQERYKSLAPMYYQKASVAIVVYDITSQASFEEAKKWAKQLQTDSRCPTDIVIALVGNKLDLADDKRQVAIEDAQSYARENKFIFFEASAKTNHNVDAIFRSLGEKLLKSSTPAPVQTGLQLGDDTHSPVRPGCCK